MVVIRNATRKTLLAERAALGVSFWLRLRGLMFRARFAPFDGLWLAPTSEIHMFWVRFPIDLVWLDASLQVVDVTPGIAPWRMKRCPGAASVIELPTGAIEKSKTRPGDQISFGG